MIVGNGGHLDEKHPLKSEDNPLMKLERSQKRRALPTKEVVGRPEHIQPFDFDLERDVPVEKWPQVDEMIENFVGDPENWEHYGMAVCTLAMFKPDLMRRLRESAEFKAATLQVAEKHWLNGLGTKTLQDFSLMTHYVRVFPEIRNMRQVTDRNLRNLKSAVEEELQFSSDMYNFHHLIALLEFFPQWQKQIRELADLKKQDVLDWIDSQDIPNNFDMEQVSHLTLARVLYPEEAHRFRGLTESHWPEILRNIHNEHLGIGAGWVDAAAILSAEDARIAEDGTMLVILRQKGMNKKPELPERLVA